MATGTPRVLPTELRRQRLGDVFVLALLCSLHVGGEGSRPTPHGHDLADPRQGRVRALRRCGATATYTCLKCLAIYFPSGSWEGRGWGMCSCSPLSANPAGDDAGKVLRPYSVKDDGSLWPRQYSDCWLKPSSGSSSWQCAGPAIWLPVPHRKS